MVKEKEVLVRTITGEERKVSLEELKDRMMYNTDTATCLGNYHYSNRRDFHYFCEELYRNNNGVFSRWRKRSP